MNKQPIAGLLMPNPRCYTFYMNTPEIRGATNFPTTPASSIVEPTEDDEDGEE